MSFRKNETTGYWIAHYSSYSAEGKTKQEALQNVMKVVNGVLK